VMPLLPSPSDRLQAVDAMPAAHGRRRGPAILSCGVIFKLVAMPWLLLRSFEGQERPSRCKRVVAAERRFSMYSGRSTRGALPR